MKHLAIHEEDDYSPILEVSSLINAIKRIPLRVVGTKGCSESRGGGGFSAKFH